MRTRIVIEVSGGLVTAVHCDDSEAEVYIVDHDNTDDPGFVEEREMRETGKKLLGVLPEVWS